MGVFTSIDEYSFHRMHSTLWGWPGQNPLAFRDPSGRVGEDIFPYAASAAGAVAFGPIIAAAAPYALAGATLAAFVYAVATPPPDALFSAPDTTDPSSAGGGSVSAADNPDENATGDSAERGSCSAADQPGMPLIGPKIQGQMGQRGWTEQQISDAISGGQQVPAINKATGDSATRYVNPDTGQSVVVDDVTNEVIHVGGPGFEYGPGSGDILGD